MSDWADMMCVFAGQPTQRRHTMTMQDPITQNVANVIGMTAEECELQPKKAARLAAAKLRANGYQRKYCNDAWERGLRWYLNGSDIPQPDYCATSLLGVALIEGNISR